MSVGKRYILDANVFIEAHHRYYGFDICPGFWLALLRQHQANRIFSIDKVKQELVKVRGKDEDQDENEEDKLSKWVKEKAPKTLFKGTADKGVVDAFRNMVNWVQNEQQFTAEAKAAFSRSADGWLVAYATANGLVVVTHEVYAPDSKTEVKLPNVCLEFEVDYCDTFDMLRDLKEQFVLKKRQRTN